MAENAPMRESTVPNTGAECRPTAAIRFGWRKATICASAAPADKPAT
jgi:hypothetical protein